MLIRCGAITRVRASQSVHNSVGCLGSVVAPVPLKVKWIKLSPRPTQVDAPRQKRAHSVSQSSSTVTATTENGDLDYRPHRSVYGRRGNRNASAMLLTKSSRSPSRGLSKQPARARIAARAYKSCRRGNYRERTAYYDYRLPIGEYILL
ncbi:hypothetical protein M409DRAFT_56367 [Zasmidium cellare ATCC 36951]|uniref:Uncharacterized protein n=1 Tax=Zasmidium cellare ATCC 36951 TaxID=1080233 RepID=A0A6A6CBU0_ZASCE|nr:uncharacterized protein M409DRAFT_56367 [Zasmidium cellare ATCC 36951]KAF2164525.1 hypothetical protein M409DRAFT_56367 [Zasmidium cellare ATCC 36951]